MAHFHFEIDASATYGITAPTLEILIDGVVVSSSLITQQTGVGLDYLQYELEYSGASPSLLQFRFNDGGEGGRSITIDNVRINGINVDTTYITMMILNNGQISGINTAYIDHLSGRTAPVLADLPAETITGSAGEDKIVGTSEPAVINAGGGADRIRGLGNDDAIFGGAGNDTIFGAGGNDIIVGEDGDDMIYGEAGADLLHGGAGNDTINAGDGNDTINGGIGNDTLIGAIGDDIIFGEDGNDTISSGIGNDYLYGDAGDDILSAGAGNDILYGGLDNDSLYGEAGDDLLYGEGGNDILYGGAANDTLYGDNGDDTLYGGAGLDLLYGGDDDDNISGGAGNDTVDGGTGTDTYVLAGNWGNYFISLSGSTYTLVASVGADGTDSVINIENFQFANGTILAANLINVAPTGANATLTAAEDTSYVFSVANFGFSDANTLDSLSAVRIDSLPALGQIRLSGIAVMAGQIITAANIAAGNLTFMSATDGNGSPYTSFSFSVRDAGGLYDPAPNTMTMNVTAANDAPVITSNGGSAAASVSLGENGTAVTTVTATDSETAVFTYSISGGLDASRFIINGTTGILTFVVAPNFEVPADSGSNNIYDVRVRVSDGMLFDEQDIAVTITNVNEAPTVTSNGGGATASVSVSENGTAVTTVTATDQDASTTFTYTISGGLDASLFTINATTGVLAFIAAPNYELPLDSGADNAYDVRVRVSDGALYDEQNILVMVTDVSEGDVGSTPGTAAPITVGGGSSGSIDTGGDRDWYSVTLTGGVKYAIWARGTPTEAGTMTDPRIYSIRNAAGTSVNSGDDDGGIGYDSLLYFTPGSTGTYYIEMGAYSSGQTGTFTLSVFTGGNTYTGSNGGNTLTGTANADYLDGLNGADTLNGAAGSDILDGGAGNDILIGGTGADVLMGGTGADTFRFTSSDAVDSIVDFSTSESDRLDIANILTGFAAGVSDIDDYLQFQTVGGDTIMRVDTDGAGTGAGFTQIAELLGTSGLNAQTLYDSGLIIAV